MSDLNIESTVSPHNRLVVRRYPDGVVQIWVKDPEGVSTLVQMDEGRQAELAEFLRPEEIVLAASGTINLPDELTLGPESILAEAEKVVNGPRAQFYGPPVINFKRIADLWDAWLLGRPDRDAPISVYDVAYMMILMKLARLQHQPYHRDSVVDIAGYAGCAEKLARDLGDS